MKLQPIRVPSQIIEDEEISGSISPLKERILQDQVQKFVVADLGQIMDKNLKRFLRHKMTSSDKKGLL